MSHKFPIYHKLELYRIALINFRTEVTWRLSFIKICHKNPTISSSDALSLFQPKILTAIDYIRNFNKQRPNTENIYQHISRRDASNVDKTDVVNSIDELVKQDVVVNKKTSWGYDSFFLYNDNLVWPIPQMELASNSTTPIIQQRQKNQTPNATLTGSNKNTNIETLSPRNCRSAILIINSSKNDSWKSKLNYRH